MIQMNAEMLGVRGEGGGPNDDRYGVTIHLEIDIGG